VTSAIATPTHALTRATAWTGPPGEEATNDKTYATRISTRYGTT
jgi:hypothetical protein